MRKLKSILTCFVLLILITGCKTIKQKTDVIVEQENQKLSKLENISRICNLMPLMVSSDCLPCSLVNRIL